jgi:transcriptional regulator with XRE-family HTH domain
MIQTRRVIEELKRLLKARGLTYTDVAAGIGMSQASVKRMMSRGDLTLSRLEEICTFAQIEFSDLAHSRFTEERLITQMSEAQERELVSSPELFLIAVCVLNLSTYEEILSHYTLSAAEVVRCLTRLDRIGFIRLLPNNHYRALVARTFSWIPNGPIQRYFKENAADFFDCDFDRPSEFMLLTNGRLSSANVALLLARLKRVAQEFSEQHAEDAALPPSQRLALSLLIAARPWTLSFMRELTRPAEKTPTSARVVVGAGSRPRKAAPARKPAPRVARAPRR